MKDKKISNTDIEKMLTYFEETALFDELKKDSDNLNYKIVNDDSAFESLPENNGIMIVKPEEDCIRLYYSKCNADSFPIRGDGSDDFEEEIDFYSRINFETYIVKINSTLRKRYIIDINDVEQRLQKGINEEVREEEGFFYLDSSGRLCFKSNLNRELTLFSSCHHPFGSHTFKNGLGRNLRFLNNINDK